MLLHGYQNSFGNQNVVDGNMGGKMNFPPRGKDFAMYNYLIVGSAFMAR